MSTALPSEDDPLARWGIEVHVLDDPLAEPGAFRVLARDSIARLVSDAAAEGVVVLPEDFDIHVNPARDGVGYRVEIRATQRSGMMSDPVDSDEIVCPFCEILTGRAPFEEVAAWPDALAIVPLGPVVDGHTLVIPTEHVADFAESPEVTARVVARAAELASTMRCPMNLITSKGSEATQSVFHLHVHLVPRAYGDGLALPWTGAAVRQVVHGQAQ